MRRSRTAGRRSATISIGDPHGQPPIDDSTFPIESLALGRDIVRHTNHAHEEEHGAQWSRPSYSGKAAGRPDFSASCVADQVLVSTASVEIVEVHRDDVDTRLRELCW